MQTPQTWIWEQPCWPLFTWNDSEIAPLLARARFAQGKILGVMRALGEELSLEAGAAVLAENGLTTSAIEGETLDLASVRSSVSRTLGLPSAGLPRSSRAVDGLVAVLLDACREHDQPLTQDRLSRWQAALFPTAFSGLNPVRVGSFRGVEPMRVVSGPFGQELIHFVAPPYDRLDSEMDAFLKWFNANVNGMDGILRASLAHLWFVTIHPFDDGNGRLARAITDLALSQDEKANLRYFSLSSQILLERKGYYEVLENTQRGGLDVSAWMKWFLTQVEASALTSLENVTGIVAKARFWMRHRHEDLNERQRKALNRMLDSGVNGFVGGMDTRKYSHLTKTSRATAYRELADLVRKGCLAPNAKGGRSSAYLLVLDEQPLTPP